MDVVVRASARAFRSSAEGRLHGVGVEDAHHPDHHPRRALLTPVHLELATPEAELQGPQKAG